MESLYRGRARAAGNNQWLIGVRGYALAGLCVAMALGVRQFLDPIWGARFPFVVLFVAVYAVIQLTSVGPSLFAIVVGFLLSEWFFVAPRHSLAISGESNRLNSVLFFLISFGVLYFTTKTRQVLARERKAKDELSQTTSRLNQAQEIANMGSFVHDLVTDEVTMSPQLEKILGFTPGHSSTPASWRELLHPDDRGAVEAALRASLERGAPFELDYRIIRRSDGQTLCLRCLAKPEQDPSGRNVRLSGVNIDVTERKRLEERSHHAQKMEGLGHLAGGMAHEFNNILAGMMLNLSLARSSNDATATSKLLQDLENSCLRAADLIKQLLAFSRQSVLERRSWDLAELVSSQLRMLRQFLGERIQVEFAAPPASLRVKADKALIEQVILNLCLNAQDAMANGGRLRLSLTREEVGEGRAKALHGAREGNFARLSVSDDGRGMDEPTKRRLFEPFFTTKEVGRGTGLGLATVRGIVEQHQGWVEVESAVGRGSTFAVYLPLDAEAAPVIPDPPREAPAASTGTILVVEDEEALRELTRMVLVKNGYRVLEAANASEALALFSIHRSDIDMIFTDMVMPGELSGLQLAQRTMAEKPSLKAIITSGYNTDQVDLEKAAESSVVYLPKPCLPRTMIEVIGKCLQPQRDHRSA